MNGLIRTSTRHIGVLRQTRCELIQRAYAARIPGIVLRAREQGIIHRDLKPANIKLRPDRTVKVLDFALAKAWLMRELKKQVRRSDDHVSMTDFRHTAATALAQLASVIVLARIVWPTRIEFVHASLLRKGPAEAWLKPDTTYVSLRALRSPR